jgi:hypothetical protein
MHIGACFLAKNLFTRDPHDFLRRLILSIPISRTLSGLPVRRERMPPLPRGKNGTTGIALVEFYKLR